MKIKIQAPFFNIALSRIGALLKVVKKEYRSRIYFPFFGICIIATPQVVEIGLGVEEYLFRWLFLIFINVMPAKQT